MDDAHDKATILLGDIGGWVQQSQEEVDHIKHQ